MDIGFLVAQVLAEVDWWGIARELRFTPQRLKVIQGLVSDQTPWEIADAVGCKVSTVRKHIQRTREQLGVRSQTAIVSIVLLTAHRLAMERAGGDLPPVT